MAKGIALLGATGSIGVNTLKVIAAHADRFRVVSLAAGRNDRLLVEQALRFKPKLVALADEEAAQRAARALAGSGIDVLAGDAGVSAAAAHPEAAMTVSAIVGAAGLSPTIAAVRAGKDIALANKECLVMAGGLFMAEVAKAGVRLIPVDSEHSAIFQVFRQGGQGVRGLVLTASGGPFVGWSRERLSSVTTEQALAHPNWSMGPKITIDSATLMNKGLEVIEARWLFDMAAENIRVVVHRESIIHSLVEYTDGSMLAQLGVPDMRTPIAVALAWPERMSTDVARLDLSACGQLTFAAPDVEAFPCLGLAYAALQEGGAAPVVLNGANEVAVAAFLKKRIRFVDIPHLLAWTLERVPQPPTDIPSVLEADGLARRLAHGWIEANSL